MKVLKTSAFTVSSRSRKRDLSAGAACRRMHASEHRNIRASHIMPVLPQVCFQFRTWRTCNCLLDCSMLGRSAAIDTMHT